MEYLDNVSVYICQRMRSKIFVILLGVTLIGCLDNPDCIESPTDRIELEMFSAADGSDFTLLIDSIYVREPAFTIYKELGFQSGDIPVYPDRNNQYIVFVTPTIKDSIHIAYEGTPKLYSLDCNVTIEYTDFELISSTLDSLQLFLDQTPPRIEVYF